MSNPTIPAHDCVDPGRPLGLDSKNFQALVFPLSDSNGDWCSRCGKVFNVDVLKILCGAREPAP